MAKRHYELDTRVLTIFFFVAMPFVAFGSFLVVSMARGALQDSMGTSFEQRAFETRFLLERYLADQMDHLRLLTLDPLVHSALEGAPAEFTPEQAQTFERAWVSPEESRILAPFLASPMAVRLRAVVRVHPQLKLLQIVDARGQVVASSGRSGRLDNHEARWFRALVKADIGGPHVTDIYRTTEDSPPVLDLVFPIYHDEGHFLGAVRALVDAAHVYSVMAAVRIGRTGRAVLVRMGDGMILASQESQDILSRQYPGFAQIEAAMREQRPYWIVPALKQKSPEGEAVTEPPRLVAFSPLKQVPDVRWLVVVQQDLAEATAPIQEVIRYLWVHFIGAFGSVILLALYLSFKLEAPVIDETLHLHEQHRPAGAENRE
jgi:hypothetical protein